MIDPQKIFDCLKNKTDESARSEIEVYFQTPSDYAELCLAGSKHTQSSNTFSYGMITSESDLKEASLFSYALAKQKYHCAALIFDKLGPDVLSKSSDLKENGFHFLARTDSIEFKQWFFKQAIFSGYQPLSQKLIDSLNAITATDQHVLTLLNVDRLTPDEIFAWHRIGAQLEMLGCKAGNFLHYLCEKNKPMLLKSILPHFKPLMIQRNEKGKMPIHLASTLPSSECLKLLGEAGSPLAVEDNKCHRPLHSAIAKGLVDNVLYLLHHEREVLIQGHVIPYANVPTASMDTPLHLLILYAKQYTETSFKEVLNTLIQVGADPYLSNAKQQNAFTLANEQLEGAKLSAFFEQMMRKRPLHLFSQHTLYARIQETVSPQVAHQMIPLLEESLGHSPATQDAIKDIEKRYLDTLKQSAMTLYHQQPALLQSFLMTLNQIIEYQESTHSQRTWMTSQLSYSQSSGSTSHFSQTGNREGFLKFS